MGETHLLICEFCLVSTTQSRICKTSRKSWQGTVVLCLPTMNSVVSNLVTLLISQDKLAKVEGGTWIRHLFFTISSSMQMSEGGGRKKGNTTFRHIALH